MNTVLSLQCWHFSSETLKTKTKHTFTQGNRLLCWKLSYSNNYCKRKLIWWEAGIGCIAGISWPWALTNISRSALFHFLKITHTRRKQYYESLDYTWVHFSSRYSNNNFVANKRRDAREVNHSSSRRLVFIQSERRRRRYVRTRRWVELATWD